jgi:hypothetical protein
MRGLGVYSVSSILFFCKLSYIDTVRLRGGAAALCRSERLQGALRLNVREFFGREVALMHFSPFSNDDLVTNLVTTSSAGIR